MKKSSFKLTGANKVSAEWYEPSKPKAFFVFAHGAGAGSGHPFMITLSEALCDRSVGTLRFNFPFMEQAGKRSRPDVPAVAHATIAEAVAAAQKRWSGPLFAGGKSFGGRMTSQWVAKDSPDGLSGLIFTGFPLHSPGKPSVDRAEHLADIAVPMLFLQGTRDTLADWKLIQGVCKKLKKSTLVKLEGADHGFKMPGGKAIDILAQSIDEWITTLI